MKRHEMLRILAERIAALPRAHPVRVAVDGIDAAGKTTLADELALALQSRGRPVIRASVDDFQRPRSERYQRGPTSPDGYYLDAFDYPALKEALLLPLGPAGSRTYRRAVLDLRTDHPLSAPEEVAPGDAVLILDGVFLLRAELDKLWDYRIFVELPFEAALQRARQRDTALFGSEEAVRERYAERYIPGQRIYFKAARPRERADAIVHNEHPQNPQLSFHG
ncbi:MAG TPA: hypothetical protein VFU63_10815 [Ktedonobacterales bacterium]|nr:hypothetical protein [Ktedonobacterales bacterium]